MTLLYNTRGRPNKTLCEEVKEVIKCYQKNSAEMFTCGQTLLLLYNSYKGISQNLEQEMYSHEMKVENPDDNLILLARHYIQDL